MHEIFNLAVFKKTFKGKELDGSNPQQFHG